MTSNERRFRATVDRVEENVVVLDVEGHAVKLPLAMFPGPVHEGEGFMLTIERSPAVQHELARSIEERLRALTGASPPPSRRRR